MSGKKPPRKDKYITTLVGSIWLFLGLSSLLAAYLLIRGANMGSPDSFGEVYIAFILFVISAPLLIGGLVILFIVLVAALIASRKPKVSQPPDEPGEGE